MEEQQIQDFVHRVSQDSALREELEIRPEDVIGRENFTPRVAQIVLKLVPLMHLGYMHAAASASWWN